MQNVTPFPTKPIVKNKTWLDVAHSRIPKPISKKKKEKIKVTLNQPPQFSYIKMTLAVVVGNGILLTGLFGMFLLYLSMVTPFVD